MISINVNPAASGAGLNLGKANEALQKSLSRLSSGRRIVTSSDDAGGLAVSMKMAAAQKRTEATAINLRNVVSYLDTQDGAFKVADKTMSRMSELSTLARDVTKNSGDIENYNKEFENLKKQMISLADEKFNGVNLFSSSANDVFQAPTSEDGTQLTDVTKAQLVQDDIVNMMVEGFKSVTVGTDTYVMRSDIANADIYSLADTGGVTAYRLPDGLEVRVRTEMTTSTAPTGQTFNEATGKFDQIHTLNLKVSLTTGDKIADGSTTFTIGVAPTSVSPTRLAPPLSTIATADLLTNCNKGEFLQDELMYDNSSDYAYLSQMALQNLADMRAQNGAEMSRVNFAQDLLNINATNLEAANSRIMDVDVAAESSQLARFQILQQAGTAMLAQANTSQQSLVRLLQG
jgi:flagellin